MTIFLIYSSGAIMTLAGLLLYKFPPKEINALYGYRTSRSMKSQEIWDYSQILGGKALVTLGLVINVILAICSLFLPLIKLVFVMLFLLISGCIVMFIFTENLLKKKEMEWNEERK
ncbi:MAG: SdpI family protein [Cyclobacteriaceae bacterium]